MKFALNWSHSKCIDPDNSQEKKQVKVKLHFFKPFFCPFVFLSICFRSFSSFASLVLSGKISKSFVALFSNNFFVCLSFCPYVSVPFLHLLFWFWGEKQVILKLHFFQTSFLFNNNLSVSLSVYSCASCSFLNILLSLFLSVLYLFWIVTF